MSLNLCERQNPSTISVLIIIKRHRLIYTANDVVFCLRAKPRSSELNLSVDPTFLSASRWRILHLGIPDFSLEFYQILIHYIPQLWSKDQKEIIGDGITGNQFHSITLPRSPGHSPSSLLLLSLPQKPISIQVEIMVFLKSQVEKFGFLRPYHRPSHCFICRRFPFLDIFRAPYLSIRLHPEITGDFALLDTCRFDRFTGKFWSYSHSREFGICFRCNFVCRRVFGDW